VANKKFIDAVGQKRTRSTEETVEIVCNYEGENCPDSIHVHCLDLGASDHIYLFSPTKSRIGSGGRRVT
jgi:hypothetical protein